MHPLVNGNRKEIEKQTSKCELKCFHLVLLNFAYIPLCVLYSYNLARNDEDKFQNLSLP